MWCPCDVMRLKCLLAPERLFSRPNVLFHGIPLEVAKEHMKKEEEKTDFSGVCASAAELQDSTAQGRKYINVWGKNESQSNHFQLFQFFLYGHYMSPVVLNIFALGPPF